MKGKFIVFEGLDGSGGETQSKLLSAYLKENGSPVEVLSYPDYQRPIGKLIHQFLHKEYDFSPQAQFLLYFVDFINDKEKVEEWIKQGKTIIADRYFTSTLVYQCLKGFSLKDALEIAKLFKLSIPDLVIYLKISPETSMERKFKEKGNLDKHEEDKEFLSRLEQIYKETIEQQVFAKWVVVDGEKSINQVFEEIKKYV